MAVTFNHLTTGSDTSNTTSYTTGTVSPAANRILYAAVFATAPSGQTTVAPSLTGTMGLTWELVRQAPATDAIRTLYWFRAATGGTAPTPGTLTFDFGAQSLTGAMWMVYEAAGADMTGTNGAGATVQSVEERRTGGTNTSVSFAFPSTVTAGNGTLACVGITVGATITPGTGWTTVGGTTTYTGPNQAFMAMHANTAQQTVAASWTGGANTWTIGVEVKAASATSGQGTASGTWSFAGAAAGARTPKGTATGSWSFTGAATGRRAPVGSAAGSWSFTGSAIGSAPVVGGAGGAALGSWSYTGAAVGAAPAIPAATGAATGAWSYTGTAAGAAAYGGSATGLLAWAGAADGIGPAATSHDHRPGAATIAAHLGAATLEAAQTGTATLTAQAVGTAALAPHAGTATLHTT